MTETSGRPQWTEGPWEAIEHGEPGSGWWSVLRGAWDVSHNRADRPGVVADSKYSAMSPAENAANAHLIAAAPHLYRELEDAAEELEALAEDAYGSPMGEDFAAKATRYRRTLAKARGEEVG